MNKLKINIIFICNEKEKSQNYCKTNLVLLLNILRNICSPVRAENVCLVARSVHEPPLIAGLSYHSELMLKPSLKQLKSYVHFCYTYFLLSNIGYWYSRMLFEMSWYFIISRELIENVRFYGIPTETHWPTLSLVLMHTFLIVYLCSYRFKLFNMHNYQTSGYNIKIRTYWPSNVV